MERLQNPRSLVDEMEYNTLDDSASLDPFYMKLTHGRSSRVLIDDEYRITGIIGWGTARVVPIYDAFGPSIFTAVEEDILHGANNVGNDDALLAGALAKLPRSYVARYMMGHGRCRRLEVMFATSSHASFKQMVGMLMAAQIVMGHVTAAELCGMPDRY